MRLQKIEVLGFKSFADRQVIVVDDHVTGVIGPNGCGKSNIVDAVRWSMGEQSAKHLRGSGMADVIFAGCATRGPAGMAEVTLTFDNDGRVPASHLDVPQVAITRRLFADGTSEYLINKVPARLRDITELLMGTGAGTKGYSIIEQGQVGKIVTSKPEERRHIIDEAAGITRFKSQKAAAERKIEATRQNLARVGDIVSELEGRISTLRRQAQKAERYRRYREEIRELDLWIASHKFLELLATGSVLEERRAGLRLRVDDLRNAISSRDAQIDAGRLSIQEVEAELQARQQEVYDADNRVRLLEAEEEYRRRERQGLLESAAASRAEADAAQRAMVGIEAELAAVEAELEALGDGKGEDGPVATVARLQAQHDGLAGNLAQARAAHETARRDLAAAQQELAESRARGQAREEAGREQAERIAALEVAMQEQGARKADAQARLSAAEAERAEQASALEQMRRARAELDRERVDLRERVAAAEVELDTKRAEVHRARSRLQSLQEIQQRYRGCASSVQVVMEHRAELARADASGLETIGPAEPAVHGILADFVEAPAHLEAAVSAVLGDRLQGVVVDDPHVAVRGVDLLKRLQEGRTTFLPRQLRRAPAEVSPEVAERKAEAEAPMGWSSPSLPSPSRIEVVDLSGAAEASMHAGPHEILPDDPTAPLPGPIPTPAMDPAMDPAPAAARPGVVGRLADLVGLGRRLSGLGDALLGDTLVVEDLSTALELWRAEGPSYSLVTLDGDRVEPSGVVVGGSPTSLDSALLKQKREIAELEALLSELTESLEATRGHHLLVAGRLAEVERAREELEARALEAEKAHVRAHEIFAAAGDELSRVQSLLTQAEAEHALAQERAEARRLEQEALAARIVELEAASETLAQAVTDTASAVDALVQEGVTLGDALTEAKVALARFQQQADALSAGRDRLRRQIGSERERIEKLREAAAKADARSAELVTESEAAAIEKAELVDKSRAATQKVHDARERHDAMRLSLDELEASVKTLRGDLEGEREQLSEVDLGLQEIALEKSHLQNDVRDRFDVEVHEILVDFHGRPLAGAAERERQKELRRILSRMGEVNLTAIEEFEEVSQRYEYLSGQKRDLEDAISQLQEAIDRINKTTRQLFREAFAAIDERFQQLFPRLFNGGRARLRMTDPTDLLGTGVEIEAQPPGKQLRSLELLSGGEKALTAVSLIFAVFLYKPSPFCILDEVDAPLDDANVARMNRLIRELASDTQFIVITHNKVTMEHSDRLYGVTMEQRGISKLVSVNMRRAVELAYN